MSNAPQHLDAAFIESKRRELTQLRDALRKTASASQLEEDGVRLRSRASMRMMPRSSIRWKRKAY